MGRIESTLLKLGGYGLIGLAVYFLFQSSIAAAPLCAAVGFLMTFLARFSDFKRFKGWGFEAEMWEEKQEEAGKLVVSLKKVAALTAREVMLQSIKSGRWGSGERWEHQWKLFEEIKAAQADILDEESKREIRKSIDRWFFHDMILREYGELLGIFDKEVELIRKTINTKYGNPISDASGFGNEINALSKISRPSGGLFKLAGSRNLVVSIEEWWAETQKEFSAFGVNLEMPLETRARLDTYKAFESLPEMPVTKELIAVADRA